MVIDFNNILATKGRALDFETQVKLEEMNKLSLAKGEQVAVEVYYVSHDIGYLVTPKRAS